MSLEQVMDRWRRSSCAQNFTCYQTLAASAARSRPLCAQLEPRLGQALRRRGMDSLYQHQWECLQATRKGRDVVVATPTASGKTLCYNLPVFDALLRDPAARALYLFPTKALARDQVEEARALAQACDAALGVAVYDGDTPPDQRRAARRRARIIATNPEMLHSGLLPHHPQWAELLGGLRYVVVDELHTYRGVFGSHLAHVLRRLLRLAHFHGGRPQLIATSATIANPAELATQLFGRAPVLVDRSGAPQGERHFLIYNPPLIDPAIGLRQSYLKSACRLTCDLAAGGVSTLMFCRSRLAMEVALRHLRAMMSGREVSDDQLQRLVRGYRGGYLPDRRRQVEQALRQGETKVVVATSALELGIDIGALDAVVIAGWPGSRAATWQRAGRAGRRLGPSLTVMVSSSEPVDQFVVGEPAYLFGQAAEHARVDPDNPAVLVPHVKCAAFELPFAPGEAYGHLAAPETGEVLGCLAEAGMLHGGGGSYHYVGDAYPAAEVSLRGPLTENFLVVQRASGQVLAEVDHEDVPEVLFEGAIYQLEGSQLQVERLDHDNRKAYVSPVTVDYYTDAMTSTRVRILERSDGDAVAGQGEVHVLRRTLGFKKIKLHTHENLGYGEIALPDREMHTTALWLTPPVAAVQGLRRPAGQIAEAALAAGRALHTTGILLLMSDGHDLGLAAGDARSSWFVVAGHSGRQASAVPDEGSELGGSIAPTLFLFDRFPGGIGLSQRLYDERKELVRRTLGMVERCSCTRGCPGCVGPGGSEEAKALACQLLQLCDVALASQGVVCWVPPLGGDQAAPEQRP